MKKRGILYLVLFLSVCIFAALYIALGFYYDGTFSYGTWFNHVYCTGKTAHEANEELKKVIGYSGIIVISDDDQRLFVDGAAIDFDVDYEAELQRLLDDQNPFAWGIRFLSSADTALEGEVSFDKNKLGEIVSDWAIFDEDRGNIYELKRDENGYFLMENSKRIPDYNSFLAKITEAISKKEYSIDMTGYADAFRNQKETAADLETKQLFEKLDELQSKNISFRILDKEISIGSKEISDNLVTMDRIDEYLDEAEILDDNTASDVLGARRDDTDENNDVGKFLINGKVCEFPRRYQSLQNFVTDGDGNLILSCQGIYEEFSKKLATLDTDGSIDECVANGDGSIVVSGSKDGKLFDKDEEYNYLLRAISGDESEIRDIDLPSGSFTVDSAELGSEFILVDMGNQHLRYYKDNKLTIEYDIVTGNTSLGRGTPVGLYHIYNKRYHTILRGADYASYVNYWLGVNKGIGIHDATWRKDFGGEIYKHNGSHGCINSPLSDMEKLYEMVEVGVPVLLYY